MKANELMIGDWIFMRLKSKDKYYEEQVFDLSGTEFYDYIPIPLTEEILKANGFDTCSVNKFISTGQGIIITIRNNYTIFSFARNHIHIKTFVHELQHALRLCGLNDLADNFKVE